MWVPNTKTRDDFYKTPREFLFDVMTVSSARTPIKQWIESIDAEFDPSLDSQADGLPMYGDLAELSEVTWPSTGAKTATYDANALHRHLIDVEVFVEQELFTTDR